MRQATTRRKKTMKYLSSVKEYRGKEGKEREQLGKRRVHCFFFFFSKLST